MSDWIWYNGDKCSPICCCRSRRVNGCHKQSSDLCHYVVKSEVAYEVKEAFLGFDDDVMTDEQTRRQDLAAGAAKKQMEGPKSRGGGTFFKYSIGCMQQPGAKREMGGHRIQMRGRGRHHWAPRWRRLCLYNFQSSYEWYRRTVLCSPHHHAISLTYARI